jgi:hypothetical protein
LIQRADLFAGLFGELQGQEYISGMSWVISGRLIGIKVAESAFAQVDALFQKPLTLTESPSGRGGDDSDDYVPSYDSANAGESSKRGGSLTPSALVRKEFSAH